ASLKAAPYRVCAPRYLRLRPIGLALRGRSRPPAPALSQFLPRPAQNGGDFRPGVAHHRGDLSVAVTAIRVKHDDLGDIVIDAGQQTLDVIDGVLMRLPAARLRHFELVDSLILFPALARTFPVEARVHDRAIQVAFRVLPDIRRKLMVDE